MRFPAKFLLKILILLVAFVAGNWVCMSWWYRNVNYGEAKLDTPDFSLRTRGGYIQKAFARRFTIRITGPEMHLDVRNLTSKTQSIYLKWENIPPAAKTIATNLRLTDGARFSRCEIGPGQVGGIDIAAKQEQEFTFAVISDMHGNLKSTREILRHISARKPAFIIGLGDFVRSPGRQNLETFRHFYHANTKLPLYAVPGECDLDKDKSVLHFVESFGPHFAAWTIDRTLFVFIDNSARTLDPTQIGWLETEIKRFDPYVDSILFFAHHPFVNIPEVNYGFSGKNTHAMAQSLFKNPKCRAVFSGHVHLSKTVTENNVTHYISGGGGGKLEYPGNFHYLIVAVTRKNVQVTHHEIPQKKAPWYAAIQFWAYAYWAYLHQEILLVILNLLGIGLWILFFFIIKLRRRKVVVIAADKI
ncbi:metallophosphoesterase family protein [Planctomycetota bacterium]